MTSILILETVMFLLLMLIYPVVQSAGDTHVHAVRLETTGSFACQNANSSAMMKILKPLQFCTFLKVTELGDSTFVTIISAYDSNNNMLQVGLMGGRLTLHVDGMKFKVQRRIWIDKWFHLCCRRDEELNTVEVALNYQRSKVFKLNDMEYAKYEEIDNVETNLTNIKEGFHGRAIFCIGDPFMDNSFIGEAVLLTDYLSNDQCLSEENLQLNSMTKWDYSAKVILKDYEQSHMCLETHNTVTLTTTGNYEEHRILCQSLRGRLLKENEAKIYLLTSLRTEFNQPCLQDISSETFKFWMHVSIATKTEMDVDNQSHLEFLAKCPYYSSNSTVISKSCFSKLQCAACIYPHGLQVLMYGELREYDRVYSISDKIFELQGLVSNESAVSMINDTWILSESSHDERWSLGHESLPIGRKLWKSQGRNESILLTFTACNEGEFTCTNGECLPIAKRCNRMFDCQDETDEDKCEFIHKQKGYLAEIQPLPLRNQSFFKLHYVVQLRALDVIKASEGSTVFDTLIVLYWNDPALTLWHNQMDMAINCSKIWSPRIRMADKCKAGMQLKFSIYRSECVINSALMQATHFEQSIFDPYMSLYSDGSQWKMTYVLNALVDVSCNFDLHDYPFGKQSCSICFWDDASLIKGPYHLVPYKPYYETENDTNYLQYIGDESLGEYKYINSSQHVDEYDTMVIAIVYLLSLYDYHLVNSFTPSFIVFIITYTTLFYPIWCFNERVTVSLTSLLTLVILFVETNNGSLETPYFKLIDIWFVVLIFLSFIVIMFNGHMHLAIASASNSDQNTPESDGMNNAKQIQKLCRRVNNILILIIPGAMLIFLFWFINKAVQ